MRYRLLGRVIQPGKGIPTGMRWWSRVGKLDQRVFDAVAAWSPSPLDHVLPRLSRSADHSLLWFCVAGLLAATRRTRLRRAAVRGAGAIVIASPVVNLLGKQLFRRARPRIDLVPPVRIRWRLPRSPAFPSGHSASAAAFVVGVATEAPRVVTVPVTVIAGAVAASRVYTGAHYPGDVLAGLAIGAGAGAATWLIWPVRATVAEAGGQAAEEPRYPREKPRPGGPGAGGIGPPGKSCAITAG